MYYLFLQLLKQFKKDVKMEPSNPQIFLTVGSSEQKNICKKLLSTIQLKKQYPITIISDDDSGVRLGSGGAVLKILKEHYIPNTKMLIINSGGMSKRSINYAVKGKVFSNIIYKGSETTLLEAILTNAQVILDSIDSGVVCCCSDILVETDGLKIPKLNNSTTYCIRTELNTASQHGVKSCDEDGVLSDYLHKLTPDELKSKCNCTEGTVLIDTGLNYFSSDITSELYKIATMPYTADTIDSHSFEINLFSDIISLLGENINESTYLETETQSPLHYQFKKLLYNHLSSFKMNVFEVKNQKFMHFGSSQGALDNIFSLSNTNDTFIKLNSYIDSNSIIQKRTIIDTAQINSCNIGTNCIISDINLSNITINDNMSVCGIKLLDGSFVCIICDINENPKNLSGSKTLWETDRFYKGVSFSESLEKFYRSAPEETFSMDYCVRNADTDYHYNNHQYLSDIKDFFLSEDYINIREDIISHYFSTKTIIDSATCLQDCVELSLPLRINLSGTWSDAMPYCINNGGEVLNAAVKIDNKKPIKIKLEKLENKTIEFSSDGINTTYNFDLTENELSDFILHKAVLEAAGFTPNTKIETGFRLTTNVQNIDKGSGLGTSSILIAGCLKAINIMFGLDQNTDELIESTFVAEQIMKTGGGWQDQAGGLTPGLKLCKSAPGLRQCPTISSIKLSDQFQTIFDKKIVLLPTGQRHFGRFIVNDVANNYLQKKTKSLKAFEDIQQLNKNFLDCLEKNDYKGFVKCVNTHHQLLKSFSDKIITARIDEIVEKCMEKTDAISILGAGGGGYLLVVLKYDVSFDDFNQFVKNSFPQIKSDIKRISICYDF